MTKQEKQKEYYLKNKEKLLDYGRKKNKENYHKNIEENRKKHREYYQISKDKRKEKRTKAFSSWYKRNKQKRRVYDAIRKYGFISEAEYNDFISKSLICCVCGGFPKEGTILHIDHDHETGKVRELLCTNCNKALGLLKEDPIRILSLAQYIIKHKQAFP